MYKEHGYMGGMGIGEKMGLIYGNSEDSVPEN